MFLCHVNLFIKLQFEKLPFGFETRMLKGSIMCGSPAKAGQAI